MTSERRPSGLRRVLRTIAWALLIAFGVGFLIGTLLRRELERPVRYIGAFDRHGIHERRERHGSSGLSADPGHVLDALTGVLVASHHEEQV